MATIKIPFLDLRVTSDERVRLLEVISRVLQSGMLVLGPEVEKLEAELASYVGRRFSVGVSSGSDAVYLALRALGIGPGDKVITPCLSWIATANAIARCGAEPVFADIGADLNILPESVERLVDEHTKCVLSVDFTGRMCDYSTLLKLCESHRLALVEDGSQAFGAMRKGHLCGAVGDLAAISHNPMKVFAALGEAGSVFTDNEALSDRLHMLRYNGTVNKEYCQQVSINGRIDAIQAAVLRERLTTFEDLVRARQNIAAIYSSELPAEVEVPVLEDGEQHSFYTYTIKTDKRDDLRLFLESVGIETKIQHPILMCDQSPFRSCRNEANFGRREIGRILSIPVHEKLNESQVTYMIEMVRKFFER